MNEYVRTCARALAYSSICILCVIVYGLLHASAICMERTVYLTKHSTAKDRRNAWMGNEKKFWLGNEASACSFVRIAIAGVPFFLFCFVLGENDQRPVVFALSLASLAFHAYTFTHSFKKGNSHRKRIAQKLISKGVFIAFFHTERFPNTMRVVVFILPTVQCEQNVLYIIVHTTHTHIRTGIFMYIFIERHTV